VRIFFLVIPISNSFSLFLLAVKQAPISSHFVCSAAGLYQILSKEAMAADFPIAPLVRQMLSSP
jgi:hypothetical protein